MKKQLQKSKRNYGALTEVSKRANIIFGDKSGRTVSRRTAHGFKNAIGLTEMHDDSAEDIVHIGILLCGAALMSKNKRAMGFAIFGLILLFICYQFGKNNSSFVVS